MSTKKSTPHVRYNLLSICLTLFAIGVGIAGYYEYTQAVDIVKSSGLTFSYKDSNNIFPVLIEAEQHSFYEKVMNMLANLKSGLLEYSFPLLFIWSVILCYKILQLVRSVQFIKKMKTTGLMELQETLQIRSEEIKEKLKISSAVRFYYSSIAAVPQVIGWLKPIVLIPVGLINRLSQEQVEAVIAHELSHIKRRDYIINCLQYVLEIFFFFNPFLLWLSNKIKEEREHCCDDLVVMTKHKKTDYINALIICSEYSSYTPVQALTLIKGKNQLLKRVTRLLTNQNLTFNNMEKFVLICLSIFMMSFASLYGTKIKELPVMEFITDQLKTFQSDTTKPKKVEHKIKIEKNTITTDENGVTKEDKFNIDTTIYSEGSEYAQPIIINGEHIVMPPMPPMPPMHFNNHVYTWSDMSEDDKKEYQKSQKEYAKSQKEYAKSQKEYAKNMRQLKKEEMYIYENGKATSRPFDHSEVYAYENGKPIKIKIDDHNFNIRINERQIERLADETAWFAVETAKLAERSAKLVAPEIRMFLDSMKINYNFDWDEEKLIEINRDRNNREVERDERRREANIIREQSRNNNRNYNRNEDVIVIGKPMLREHGKMASDIRNELILDQIVTSKSLRSVELNDRLFMVNGIIQSKKIHKKYVKKYLGKEKTELNFNY